VLVARRQYLSLRGFLVGLAIFPVWVVVIALLDAAFFWLIRTMDSAYSTFGYGFTYNQPWYGASALFLSLAVSTACLSLFVRWNWQREFAAACLFWQMPLLLLATIAAPGASYLLQWPALFAAVSFFLLCRKMTLRSPALIAIGAVLAFPSLTLLGATTSAAFTGLGLGGLSTLMVLIVLLFAFLCPQLQLIGFNNWHTQAALVLVSVILFCVALFHPGFDRDHPRQVQVSYFQDIDSGEARWVARPHSLAAFEKQYFGSEPTGAALTELVPPIFGQLKILQQKAPAYSFPLPEIKLIGDQAAGAERRLQLHVAPGRQAYAVLLWAEDSALHSASIEGGAWMPESQAANQPTRPLSLLACYGFPEAGFDLSLLTADTKPLKLRIEVISKGLPPIPGFPSQLSDRGLIPVQERPPLFPAFSTVTSRALTL
jgi:hypothetical protein